MGKQEQLIEYIVRDIVDMFSSDQNIEYVYDLFKDEMNFGRIVQAEI